MLFWTILFPLMFLVVFAGLFGDFQASKSKIVQIGPVMLFDQMPPEGREAFGELFEMSRSDNREAALEQVRKGDEAAAAEMDGSTLVLHYSQADQVKAATVRGTLESFIQRANLAAAGVQQPAFTLRADPVEDKSLKPIQFYTPGLLAWAVAMSGTFGAAMTLVMWRKSFLLRRLRLSPVPTTALVGSRSLITLGMAVLQTVIFLAVGVFAFGLKLSGQWWLGIPVLLAGALAFMSVGLLVGAVSKTPDGASGLANVIILPMAFLSGTFIPLEAAPPWMSVLAKVLPMGQLNSGVSAVMVRGQGAEAVWVPIAVLLAFTVVVGLVAAKVFRWDAD